MNLASQYCGDIYSAVASGTNDLAAAASGVPPLLCPAWLSKWLAAVPLLPAPWTLVDCWTAGCGAAALRGLSEPHGAVIDCVLSVIGCADGSAVPALPMCRCLLSLRRPAAASGFCAHVHGLSCIGAGLRVRLRAADRLRLAGLLGSGCSCCSARLPQNMKVYVWQMLIWYIEQHSILHARAVIGLYERKKLDFCSHSVRGTPCLQALDVGAALKGRRGRQPLDHVLQDGLRVLW